MKLHQLFDPTDRNNIRTFIPNPDGTVTVWMFIEGMDGDKDLNMLDEVMSLDAAVKWNDLFRSQGWVEEIEDNSDYDENKRLAEFEAQAHAEDKRAYELETDSVDYSDDPPTYAEECDAEVQRQQRNQDLQGQSDEDYWGGI